MVLDSMTATQRIIRMQAIVGLVGGLLLFASAGWGFAIAFAYGVLLMVANAWWLLRRLDKVVCMDASAGQRSLLLGAALRFVALIFGLLLGQLMGLHLMLVAAGIFVAQVLVYVVALVGLRKEQF